MSEHIKIDDNVYFTVNFYHPTSGYSYPADATPRWYVYESGSAIILQGDMVQRTDLVGAYYGTFVASAANGFDDAQAYEVQVSGMVEGISGFNGVKEFVIEDLAETVWDAPYTSHTAGGSMGAWQTNTYTNSRNLANNGAGDGAGLGLWEGSTLAAHVASGAWDEGTSGHTIAGTFGEQGKTDIDAILEDTNEIVGDLNGLITDIGSNGAGLTAIPWNSNWDAEVESEVTDALNTYDPPTKTELDTAFTEIKGSTWSSSTDTLEHIRDKETDIETDTNEIVGDLNGLITDIGANGAGLTAIPWNSDWDAEVESEATDALNAYDPPTNAEMEARTKLAAEYFDWTTDTVANVTTVASVTNIVNANVVQVSGDYVHIDDFKASIDSLNDPTAADIADAVWDENTSGHTTADTFGEQLKTDVDAILQDTNEVQGDLNGLITDIGSNGAGLTAIPWNASWDAEVQSEVEEGLAAYDAATGSDITGLNDPTAAAIADAVWDEILSGHVAAGSTGSALTTASGNLISGDWGDATAASQSTITTHLTDIKGAGWTSTDTLENIYNDTNEIVGDLNGLITDIGSNGTGLTAIPWNSDWDAEVESEVTDALNTYDPPTNAEMEARTKPTADYFDWTTDTVANVTTVTTTTNVTNIVNANTVQVSGEYVHIDDFKADIDSLNDPAVADIADAVWDESTSGHTGGGTFGEQVKTDIDAILEDTNEVQGDLNGLITDIGTNGDGLTAIPWNSNWDAEVESEVDDALNNYDAATRGQLMSVSGSITDTLSTMDQDIYFANIKYIKDTANEQDEFAVQWFVNDQPVSSGELTNPAISVYNTSTGAALLEHQLMTYASPSLGVVRHNLAYTMASGEPYLVETSGTIGATLRTWKTVVGIDAL